MSSRTVGSAARHSALRLPGHPVLAEQQPGGAAKADGTQRDASPGVTAVTAVADDHGVATMPPSTAGTGRRQASAAGPPIPAVADQPGLAAGPAGTTSPTAGAAEQHAGPAGPAGPGRRG